MSLEIYRELETKFLDTVDQYPQNKFGGRGIVTACGSNECYYVGAYVMIKLLRQFKCYLPVEVWKFEWERDDKWDSIFNGLDGVEVRYYNKHISDVDRKGWCLKPFAVLESKFKEVLFLDSDIAPAKSPEYLFNYQPYLETGSIFWSDTCRTTVPARPTEQNKSRNAFWHLADHEEIDEREFESGQLLVNKEKCWREINLTCHYNRHADWYYTLFLGDKETFHLAWRRLRKEFVFFQNSTSINVPGGKYFYQYDNDDELVFQHRSGNKFHLNNNITDPEFVCQKEIFEYIEELKAILARYE
jgi:alpha 1,2-mannosyltransferase